MKSFKSYIAEAATEGAVLEEIIVAVWNNEKQPPARGIDPLAGDRIVAYLKKNGVTGKRAYKLETKGVSVTPEWSQFWAPESVPSSTKTPKTDIIIGTDRFSLKMGPAQLMSGGVNESRATFYAAARHMKTLPPALSAIWANMNELAKTSKAAGGVEAELKLGKDKILSKANEVNNLVKEQLRSVFNTDAGFKRAFIEEAMTGKLKFSESSLAYAEYMLSTNPEGTSVKLFAANDKSFIDKVAAATSVTVRFKSTSVKAAGAKTGEYRYWSVVSLGVKKLEEEIEAAGDMLNEGLLTNIYNKVKSFMTNMFAKIWNAIKDSVKKILEFFGIEPMVAFKNRIDFSRF